MTPLDPAFLSIPLAHRALHDVAKGRPENSRAAIRAAIAAGYGIEIDIQPSADGVPMVFHDYQLNRLTAETGAIARRSATELAAIPLTGGTEGIPTLHEVLALVAGQVPLLIEIKDQDGAMGPAVGPLERAIAAQVAGYVGPLALMSFNPHSIAALRDASPALCLGLTTSAYSADDWPLLPAPRRDALREIPDAEPLDVAFISHEAADLDRPRVADLKAQGRHVLCWTIRSAAEEARARHVAQNITFEGYQADFPA
ncbi:glycerophosphodiester phosphodiesterase family protein [Thioclava sp. A2]|uniref:glycerophosphodiester phosphodiesterase family protein n=1 Tax=Thioclava sp. FCG-A2 TaxID=3080562 RepID=UPI002953B44A|nr:glycerophosphodiester phosphodiesterase family protein [Thioclava sp. A2]MDV7271175.1 glycerophosphodiester phosphodiesterase family protein [Thioclava sp. A2]